LSRARVLLADDHEEFLAVEVQLLEHELVTTASDGRQALEEAARLSPDLVILDISMSKMDGTATARHPRAVGSREKVIFLGQEAGRPASVGVLGFEHRNRNEPVIGLWNHVAQPRE
jgi:CheY-like chemotaxis protein